MIKKALETNDLLNSNLSIKELSLEEEMTVSGGLSDEDVEYWMRYAGRWCGSRLYMLLETLRKLLEEKEKNRSSAIDSPIDGYDCRGYILA